MAQTASMAICANRPQGTNYKHGDMRDRRHACPRLHVPPPRPLVRAAVLGKASATAATTEPDTLSAAFWDYNLLFRSQRAETSAPVQLRVTEGAIPPDFPAGTYYLARPGMFSDDHGSTVHPLDGHGFPAGSFRFNPGDGVHYAARYTTKQASRRATLGISPRVL
ncbi:carotenoid cleavage dioxygenase 7, chloroplastic [Hordeum vulgare]|nr:carotenoid cleavage dioxygenase 7, chloroplastic [Hordeum vulgare]